MLLDQHNTTFYHNVTIISIAGTLLLHELLEKRNEQLDFFVLYSSITSILGNEGQTSYAAANSFLNSFADYRMRTLKKPCLSISWGAMGGAGMLKRNAAVAALLQQSGLHLLDIQTGESTQGVQAHLESVDGRKQF